jgi:CRP/FNR family transcriptional regulator
LLKKFQDDGLIVVQNRFIQIKNLDLLKNMLQPED